MIDLKDYILEALQPDYSKIKMSDLKDDPHAQYFIKRATKKKLGSRATQQALNKKVKKQTDVIKKDLTSDLTTDEKKVLDLYTNIETEDYLKINTGLRKGKLSKKHQKMVDVLDNAFRIPLKKDLVLYRSSGELSLSDDKGFKSLSIDPQNAAVYARDGRELRRFKVPKGTLYLYDERENEILIPRHMMLKDYLY